MILHAALMRYLPVTFNQSTMVTVLITFTAIHNKAMESTVLATVCLIVSLTIVVATLDPKLGENLPLRKSIITGQTLHMWMLITC